MKESPVKCTGGLGGLSGGGEDGLSVTGESERGLSY